MATDYKYIAVENQRGVLILTITLKEINSWEAAEALRHELVDAFTESASNKVVVDLRNVQYMSSVGYHPFLSLNTRARHTEGLLVICNLSEFIANVFTATRLLINPKSESSVFLSADTLDDAIATLNSNQ